ncbi:MAG: PQQ-binding-like beta-propeller repeat protein [Verrucomicrobiaceae bacterium]
MKSSLTSAIAVTSILISVAGAEWNSWRGPNGNGSLDKGVIAKSFSADGSGVSWKAELPDRGCSTPIEVGGALYLTSPIDGNDALISYDLKGKERWRLVSGKQTPGRGQRVGSGSNSSPVSDGERVIGYFKSGRVLCADLEGKKQWEVNLQEKYGKDHLWWDQGTSPVMAGGNVVIAVMQTEGNSYLVALDPKSGEEVWKTDRNIETEKESGDSYTTPHVVEVDGVETVISFGADHVTGHEAKTGKLLWTCGGINPETKGMWRTIASSVVTEGIVVVPHGRGEYLMGIKAGGSGDVTKERVLWRKEVHAPDAATPVARDGKVYLLVDRGKDRGLVLCVDAKTGDTRWEGKLPKSPSTYYASPILVGNQLCCPREDGVVIIAEVKDDGLGEITENRIGEAVIASPIVADGSLILRGAKHLWSIR